MHRPHKALLAVLLLLLACGGAAVAAPAMELTLGYLPESTADELMLVRGVFTPGALIEIRVNNRLEASYKPSGDVYRVEVKLDGGPNRIEVSATLNGRSLVQAAEVFRTTADFRDLAGHWAERDAEMLATLGIVNGVSEGQFGPDLELSRAQLAKMVSLTLRLPVDAGAHPTFADAAGIPEWARAYVAAAGAGGLITGFPDNTFRPNLPITRLQVAVVVARSLRLKGYQPTGPDRRFADQSEIPGWAASDAALAVRAGILTGTEDGRFAPARTATRAEAAAIVRRLWQIQQ